MYLASVVGLLAVLPLMSVALQALVVPGSDLLFLLLRWLVFWAVGVRLILAGIRQVVNPEFTAATIFRIRERSADRVVSELGLANIAMGTLGLLTVIESRWLVPAGLVGGLYYGLAGAKHVLNAERNAPENIALVSDLLIFVVLAVLVILALIQAQAA